MKTKTVCLVKNVLAVAMTVSLFGLTTVSTVTADDTRFFFREKRILSEGLMIVNETYGETNRMYVTMFDSKTLALKWQQDFNIHTGGGCVTRYFNRYCMKNKMFFAYDTKNYHVKCIGVTTGKILWNTCYNQKKEDIYEMRWPIGVSRSGRYFYARIERTVYVFDGRNGKLANSFIMEGDSGNSNTIEVSEGVVYINHKEGYKVINALTGGVIYTLPNPKTTTYENEGAFNETGFYVDKEGYGYVRNANDVPCKFDVKTGKILWTGKKAIVANFAYEDKANVYLYATNHDYKKPGAKIASIRKSDGKTNWEINTVFTNLDVKTSMASFGSGSGKPAEDPMPMCSGTSFQVNFLGDKVIVGLGLETLHNKCNIGFQMFRLSDGKELVRKSSNIRVDRAILLPDGRNLFAENGDFFSIIDSWTGKDKSVTPKLIRSWSQNDFNLENNLLSLQNGNEIESVFTVIDITSAKIVWTLPDKDKDQDYIFTINGKIIITGGGVIDIFDLKIGKFENRLLLH